MKGARAGCIDDHTIQLKIGDQSTITDRFRDRFRKNDSIFELPFTKPASQDCTLKVSLVDGNGKVNDIRHVDCGKLVVPAWMQICVMH